MKTPCLPTAVVLLTFALGMAAQGITDTYNSNASWQVPAGVTSITVEAWGGGGNGASGGTGGGGGGGAYARSTLSTSPGTTYTIVVAGSGSGGSSSIRIGTGSDLVRAAGGATAFTTNGALGGQVDDSVGSTRYAGGRGASGASGGAFGDDMGGGGGGSAFTNAAGNYTSVTTSTNGGQGTGDGGAGGVDGNGTPGFSPGGGGGGSTTASSAPGAPGRVTITYIIQLPQINISGNNVAIADGDGSPSLTDHTDFGTVSVSGGTITRVFTISNTGNAVLNLTGSPRVNLPGGVPFTVTQQPSASINPGQFTTFEITYDPTSPGTHLAGVVVVSNDNALGPYDFTIRGTGTAPEIVVEQAAVSRANGATVGFGGVALGETADLVFTVRNTGGENLLLNGHPAVDLQGGGGSFVLLAQPALTTIPAAGSTNFTVRFTAATVAGAAASITIANNDSDEGTFTLQLTATGLSSANDTDNDGLNDVAELKLAALGFDWETTQTALVTTYFAHANTAGLYTASQVQTLHAGTPVIARDPTSGRFQLTLDWRRTTDLTNGFQDFPAPPGSTVQFAPSGDVVFEFTDNSPAAFYRLQVDD